MRDAQMMVCRCCGQATTAQPDGGVDADHGLLTLRIDRPAPMEPRRTSALDGDVEFAVRAADGIARSHGVRGPSSVELLTSVIAMREAAELIERFGGDRARLGQDLAALSSLRAEAEAALSPAGVIEAGKAAAASVGTVVEKAILLARGEGGGTVATRHLLAAFAAADCAVPGAKLLQSALAAGEAPGIGDGGAHDARASASFHRSTVGDARLDGPQGGVVAGRNGVALADVLAVVERRLSELQAEVSVLTERLRRLERRGATARDPHRTRREAASETIVDTAGRPSASLARGASAVPGISTATAAGGQRTERRSVLASRLRRRRRLAARAAWAGTRRRLRGLRRRFWVKLRDRRTARRGSGWQVRSRSGWRRERVARRTYSGAIPTTLETLSRALAPEADTEMEAGRRFYLAADDDIVDAPGIGPRTAERFRAIGVNTVRDLLAADATDVSHQIATRWIRPETIAGWQAQARLVATVPWLRGTHAQLLVGAGFPTVEAITEAAPGAVAAAILRFAQTREGRSILRDGAPPEPDRIEGWLLNACEAEHQRVA